PDASRDDDALALQILSDGSQRELRTILDRLDTAHVEADELTVHTPDLDDVFFALTDATRVPHQSDPSNPSEQSDPSGAPARSVNSQEDEVR
ncbi:hypothetical protein ACWCWD_35550, partial [Streptomyces sp. NPDC001493]